VATVRFVDESEYRRLSQNFSLHFLQSIEWGGFKSCHGWKPYRVAVFDPTEICVGLGQFLKRRLTSRYTFAYFPKGPVYRDDSPDSASKVVDAINTFLSHALKDVVFVRYETDILEAVDGIVCGNEYIQLWKKLGMHKAPSDNQYRDTRKLKLGNENETWDSFTSKQRNKIKVAPKKEVVIRKEEDESIIDTFYTVYHETAQRNNIFIHSRDYYREFFRTFVATGIAEFYAAYYQGEMLAGAFIVHYGKESIYMYSGSCDKERNRRPNEAMQWEAIREAIRRGSIVYDFWGVAPYGATNHSWTGLSEFKAGFGGNHIRYIGCYDYPCIPFLYTILMYAEQARKIILAIKKKVRRR